MIGWPTCSFVNARVVAADGEATSIRFRRRVLSIGDQPRPGDHVVDLEGRFVLPGLVNAHDHLELNHYGSLKVRERYGNAREWIDDLRPLIRSCQEVRVKSRINLSDRLFIGGLKNILSGVTTVGHHNPLYSAFGLHFPVRLLDRFGWAHSLGMESEPVGAHGEPGGIVSERLAATPDDAPFVVHAAEGVDEVAAEEIDELERAGCVRPNTVIVHGLGIQPPRWHQLFARGVSLVWCPASNRFLFDRALCMPCLLESSGARGRVALGTDSRVTGSRDLLDELREASQSRVPSTDLLRMVTSWAASVLRIPDAGRIFVGACADLLVIPRLAESAADALLHCARSDVGLVVRGGTPLVGDPSLADAFSARGTHVRRVEVDGRARLMQAALARRIERCTIQEPGVRALASSL
jgi:cytosine/adenosine deaminase-related metal-dependent hydrolase